MSRKEPQGTRKSWKERLLVTMNHYVPQGATMSLKELQ